MLRLAAVGLGSRASGVFKILREIDPEVELTGLVDPEPNQVRERLKSREIEVKNVSVFASVQELVKASDRFDGVLIGTRCHLHTPMAALIAPTGLPLYLEKPVAISREQLETLEAAFRGREDSVVVSFPLRRTPLFTAAIEIIRSGRLGTINQVQAFNNVTYGGVYYGSWYRNFDEVGGLWLQKATHDFDYINQIVDSRPTMIAATSTRLIYGGDKPHDLRCSACDQTAQCAESPRALAGRGDSGGMPEQDHDCAFSREIKNQDAGSALLMYANGVHASYSQNFVTRRSAGRRGAIVTGYHATLEFDWYTNEIRVVDHHRDRVDKIQVRASTGHSGGDHVLAANFIDVMRGRDKSRSDLRWGLLSAAMCLAARESARSRTFQPVVVPGISGGAGNAATDAAEPVYAVEV